MENLLRVIDENCNGTVYVTIHCGMISVEYTIICPMIYMENEDYIISGDNETEIRIPQTSIVKTIEADGDIFEINIGDCGTIRFFVG